MTTMKQVEVNDAAPLFVKKFHVIKNIGKNLSNCLKKFVKDEAYSMESIVDDLNEGYDGSTLVDFLAEELNWETDAQKKKVCYTLKILYGIENEDIPELHFSNENVAELLKFDWNCTPDEKQAIRNYMHVQCPGLIKDGENEEMVAVMAVGKKNGNPHLLTSLYDVFTKYRSDHRMSNDENGNIPKKSEDFVKENVLCQKLSSKVCKTIAVALESYEHRLIPGFKSKPAQIYDDSCEAFIEHTIFVAKAIRNVFKTFDAECLPLQVDLIIIPRKMTKEKTNILDLDSDDEDDDDDDDGDEDGEIKSDENENSVDELENVFQRVMTKNYNQEYIKQEMKYDVDANLDGQNNESLCRDLTDYIKRLIDGNRCQRISIVIDRRFEPCVMYVYTLPEGKNAFADDFCLTTLVHMSSKFVIPEWSKIIEKAETFPFCGGIDARKKYFQVSYQVLSEKQTRMQWIFCGNGIRLTPKVIVNEWPKVFAGELPKMYSEEYIKQQLELKNQVFDLWAKQFEIL